MFYTGIEKFRKTCFIGLFDEEKKIPNTLEIDIKIGKECKSVAKLPFWDYSILSDITNTILNSEVHFSLLEDVLKKIVEEIKIRFEYNYLFIKIKKLHPPTNEYLNSSFIEWEENI